MWAAVQAELGVEEGNPLIALPLTHWVRVSPLNSEPQTLLISSLCEGPLLTGITGS